MTQFLQACGAMLLAVILMLALSSSTKELGVLLSLAACCMAALVAMNYLKPVMDFLGTLETLGGLDGTMVATVMKVTGIGIIAEIACLVCTDAGNAALGKSIQLMGTGVILWLSVPLFQAFLELLQSILGEL